MSQSEEELIELLEDTLVMLNSMPRRIAVGVDSYELAAKLERALEKVQKERAKNEQNPD